jgi:hypothetical protein
MSIVPFGIWPTVRYSRAAPSPSFVEVIVQSSTSPG